MARPKKSSLAKARDMFFWTKRGEKLCEGTATGQYLKNRLEDAFVAGWDACKKYIETK